MDIMDSMDVMDKARLKWFDGKGLPSLPDFSPLPTKEH